MESAAENVEEEGAVLRVHLNSAHQLVEVHIRVPGKTSKVLAVDYFSFAEDKKARITGMYEQIENVIMKELGGAPFRVQPSSELCFVGLLLSALQNSSEKSQLAEGLTAAAASAAEATEGSAAPGDTSQLDDQTPPPATEEPQ